MAELGYRAFDADNHYYEAEDAFTRHIDPRMRKRAMQWATLDGRKRLLVGGRVNRFIPNPTFDPVAKPGCLEEFFRGRNPEGLSMAEAFGELEPIRPEYRDRDARLALLDAQNLEGAFFFPTLGVGMEQALVHDPPALCAAFRAFNRWLEEDWGFAYKERIFAAPYITLVDPDWAVEELEWALTRDVRVLVMRSGPVAAPGGSRSPADPVFDPFWSRASEAGVTVALHGCDAGYGRFAADWGEPDELHAFRFAPLKMMLSPNPIHDTLAAMVAHGLFHRHRNLRIATVENGSGWVSSLVKAMKKTYGQMPHAFPEDPLETFRRHVWISPFYEDDLRGLRDLVGCERIMMGSDFPHAEGIAEPTDWVQDIADFPSDQQRLVMREVALDLSRPRPASAA